MNKRNNETVISKSSTFKCEYVSVGVLREVCTGFVDEVQPNSCGIWTAIPPSTVSFFFKILVHDVLLWISSSCFVE